jgi:hypothetical protein
MKLDRKEILKALETITIGEERIWWKEWSGCKRSHFDEVVVDLVLHAGDAHQETSRRRH